MADLLYDTDTNKWYRAEDGRPEPEPLTHCAHCGQDSVKHRQEAYGDSWNCQNPECGHRTYFSIGD
jgi:hypothetical protein